MCVMIKKFPSCVLLLLLLTRSTEPTPPYNFNAGLFYLFCFLHFQMKRQRKLRERGNEQSFFIYDFFKEGRAKRGNYVKCYFTVH